MPDFRAYIRAHLPPLHVSGAREADIVEELALEFEESYERALANGSTPEDAWQQVVQHAIPWHQLAEQLRSELRETNPVAPVPELTNHNVFLGCIADVRHDLRYAFRQLSRSRGFAVIAIVTLALGIGANTAIFSLLNAVVFRSLPVSAPHELVFFGNARAEGSTQYLSSGRAFSYPFYREFRERNHMFSNIAAIHSVLFGTHGRVDDTLDTEKIAVELVSGSYFDTLGIRPTVGRAIREDDDRIAGAHPVAVASYSWWQRRLRANPAAIGETITINSTIYTLIGVAPPGFFGVTVGRSPDLWIPLMMQRQISPAWNGLSDKRFQTLHLIGRLKPGWTTRRAGEETTSIYRQIASEHAAPAGAGELNAILHQHIELISAATGRSPFRVQFSSPLTILMAVVAVVLLIACANIANILLARALVRHREIAIRISLGAARGRLIRQLLLESGLVASAGAIVGVFFAWAAGRLLLGMISKGSQTMPIQIAPDVVVLSFTLAVTVVTVLLFGTAPAFLATRLDVVPALKEGRATTSSSKRNRLARVLVVAQVALSLVLVIGAGLFLRSVNNLKGTDSGFDKENVLVIGIDPAASGYKDDGRLEAMMKDVEERIGELPGIAGTSFVFYLFDGGAWRDGIQVPGRTESENDPGVNHNVVGPQFFDALKMPIVLGRGLDAHDNLASSKVAVINETMSRLYFNNSPLGHTFGVADDLDFQNLEVVGVVKDAKYEQLDEKQRPAAFYPHAQHIGGRFLYTFIARHTGDSARLIPEIRRAVHDIDPNLTLGEITTLEQLVEDSVVDKRLVAQLSAFFGAVAAFLACIGIYGVVSFGVARRTGEFGIRMALGARSYQVLWIILRDTLQMTILGTAIGVFLAIGSGTLIQNQLFGLSSTDPITLMLATFAIIAVALFAGYWPARRAMQVDPMVALRHE
jgi:predicted permease